MFALTMTVLMVTIGAGIDFGRVEQQKSIADGIADATVIAAVAAAVEADKAKKSGIAEIAKAAGLAAWEANAKASKFDIEGGPEIVITSPAAHEWTATATFDEQYSTHFMSLFGQDMFPVRAFAWLGALGIGEGCLQGTFRQHQEHILPAAQVLGHVVVLAGRHLHQHFRSSLIGVAAHLVGAVVAHGSGIGRERAVRAEARWQVDGFAQAEGFLGAFLGHPSSLHAAAHGLVLGKVGFAHQLGDVGDADGILGGGHGANGKCSDDQGRAWVAHVRLYANGCKR